MNGWNCLIVYYIKQYTQYIIISRYSWYRTLLTCDFTYFSSLCLWNLLCILPWECSLIGLATFQVLKSHAWLMATGPDSIALQGSANFSCETQMVNILSFTGHMASMELCSYREKTVMYYIRCVNEQAWLCSNKSSFTKTGGGLVVACRI